MRARTGHLLRLAIFLAAASVSACAPRAERPLPDPAPVPVVTEADARLAHERAAMRRRIAAISRQPASQTGIIEPSPATETAGLGLFPVPPVRSAPPGSSRGEAGWDPDKVREWRVRAGDGEVFTIFQPAPRLHPGAQVKLLRAAGDIHFIAG